MTVLAAFCKRASLFARTTRPFQPHGHFLSNTGSHPRYMIATLLNIFSQFSSSSHATTMSNERTFIMIKPDGVQRGLVGKIIQRFEEKGFKLVAMKYTKADEDLLKKHYGDLASKPFFPTLVKFISSGPLVPMVWEGKGVVATGRVMLGETNPADSKPGTIRGDYCIDIGRNICHGSDSVESAKKEIALWFNESDLNDWTPCQVASVYE